MQQVALADFADDDLITEEVMCRFIGGDKSPINRSTLWRGIKAGRFPAPIKIGTMNRWRAGDGRKVIALAEAARDSEAA